MTMPPEKRTDFRMAVAVSAVATILLAVSGVAAAAIALIVGTAARLIYGFIRASRR